MRLFCVMVSDRYGSSLHGCTRETLIDFPRKRRLGKTLQRRIQKTTEQLAMISSRLFRKEVARQALRGGSAFFKYNLRIFPAQEKDPLVRSFSSQKEWQERGVLDENGLTAFSTIREFILFCTWHLRTCKPRLSHHFLQTKCKSMPVKCSQRTNSLARFPRIRRLLNI